MLWKREMSSTRRVGRRTPALMIWLLLSALMLVVAACGEAEEAAPEDTAAEDEGEVTPGTEADVATEDTEAAADEGAAGELQPVRFALTNQRSIQYHPVYVALEAGLFEEEGLDVQLAVISGSSAVVQQIAAGNIDIGLPASSAVVQGVASGNDLVWYYTHHYRNTFGLATPEDSEIQSLEDLEGRVIGVSELSGGEVPQVRGVMSGLGFTDGEDYQVRPIGEGGALTYDALDTGQADAYSSSVFDVATVDAAGIPLRQLLPDEFLFFPGLGLTVTRETFENDQDMLIRFARGLAKGQVFSDANEDAARAIAEEAEPELFEDTTIVEAFWDATIELETPPPDLEANPPYGAHYLPGWDTYLGFITQGTEEEGGIPEGAFSVDEVVTDELIDEINDFDSDAVAEAGESYEVGG